MIEKFQNPHQLVGVRVEVEQMMEQRQKEVSAAG